MVLLLAWCIGAWQYTWPMGVSITPKLFRSIPSEEVDADLLIDHHCVICTSSLCIALLRNGMQFCLLPYMHSNVQAKKLSICKQLFSCILIEAVPLLLLASALLLYTLRQGYSIYLYQPFPMLGLPSILINFTLKARLLLASTHSLRSDLKYKPPKR